MNRRMLLALPFAMALRADSARDVWDLLGDAATALSDGDLAGFLDCFDPKMPGYEELRVDASALVAESPPPSPRAATQRGGVSCSIELVSDQGDDQARSLELNWILDIRQTEGSIGASRREQKVKVQVAKVKKKWRIVAFDPPGFFAPPDAK
jgi:hypothetical protein